MFSLEKNGYCKKEVDSFLLKQKAELNSTISDLRAQNIELKAEIEELSAELKNYRLKEDSIKDAMILTAKKTKELEEQSVREYRLECEKVKKLFYKWSDTIEMVRKKYGLINTEELNTRKFYLDIENLFDNNLNNSQPMEVEQKDENLEVTKTPSVEEQKVYHKELLNRMSGLLHSVSTSVREAETRKYSQYKPSNDIKTNTSSTKNTFAEDEYKKESERLKTVSASSEPSAVGKNMIKPIVNSKGNLKGYSSLLDKYLSDDEDDEDLGAYGKIITNRTEEKLATGAPAKQVNAKEQQKLSDREEHAKIVSKALNIPQIEIGEGTNGFNLKEAVSPKESLEEIMQAFDL